MYLNFTKEYRWNITSFVIRAGSKSGYPCYLICHSWLDVLTFVTPVDTSEEICSHCFKDFCILSTANFSCCNFCFMSHTDSFIFSEFKTFEYVFHVFLKLNTWRRYLVTTCKLIIIMASLHDIDNVNIISRVVVLCTLNIFLMILVT